MHSQSCITAIGFPDTMERLIAMADWHLEESGRWESDLESILHEELRDHSGYWSAPRWMTEGDILFFYQTSFRPNLSIRRLQKQVDDWPERKQSLTDLLERNLQLFKRFAGSIFACGRVVGASEYLGNDGDPHFRGRIFAPYGHVNVFANPLAGDSLKRCVTLSPGGTITSLFGGDFEKVRSELSTGNVLPEYLASAIPGGVSFRNVDKANWRLISCSPRQRFIDEAQVRSYYLDYLLGEAKDPRTQLLEECDCYRGGEHTGIADYFMKIGGRWVPVEAKLSLLCERDILSQLAKYVNLQMIVPRKGSSRGERLSVVESELCLVADQDGLYVVDHGRFVAGEPGAPAWTREELGRITPTAIQAELNRFLP